MKASELKTDNAKGGSHGKRVPKHIKRKVERMSRLMTQIVELNQELEGWLEANGIEDGWDFMTEYRQETGYEISGRLEWFYEAVEKAIN